MPEQPDEHTDEQEAEQPEEFLNRAARRAQRKGGGARLDRSAAQSTGRPTQAGSGPSTRQFTNRRTGG